MFINKRILIALGVVGILLLGGLGFTVFLLLTQSNASANAPAVTPTPSAPAATPSLSANHVCATGVISSIDTQGQTFVVKEKGSKTVTVSTDTQTIYHKRGTSGVAFKSLSVGQRVRVTSQSACDATATTVTAKAVTIVVSNAPGASPTPTP